MYSLEEIKAKVAPVARKHQLNAVYIFGSYARGDATPKSDVDLLIDTSQVPYSGFKYFTIHTDFEHAFSGSSIDIVDMNQVLGENLSEQNKILASAVLPERILVYGQG